MCEPETVCFVSRSTPSVYVQQSERKTRERERKRERRRVTPRSRVSVRREIRLWDDFYVDSFEYSTDPIRKHLLPFFFLFSLFFPNCCRRKQVAFHFSRRQSRQQLPIDGCVFRLTRNIRKYIRWNFDFRQRAERNTDGLIGGGKRRRGFVVAIRQTIRN